MNLPRGVSETRLLALAECFGNVQYITIDQGSFSPPSPTARIKFISHADASRAVQGINGELFESKKLVAKMDVTAVEDGLATFRSTKVKVSWFAPSQRAWAHYNGISTARQQSHMLDGKSFNGSKISAMFQEPNKGQIRSFSVEIRGLPRNPDRKHLQNFCRAQSVSIAPPSYDLSLASSRIKDALKKYGDLESFDVLPLDPKKPKVMAFAQFRNADSAELAVKELHSTQQSFLGGGPVWLENIHALKYSIPSLQFSVLKADIDFLRDTSSECKVRYYEVDEGGQALDPVCIRVFGSQLKALGRIKGVWIVVEGRTIHSEHRRNRYRRMGGVSRISGGGLLSPQSEPNDKGIHEVRYPLAESSCLRIDRSSSSRGGRIGTQGRRNI